MKKISYALLLIGCLVTVQVQALTDEQKARMEKLSDFSLADLQQVEIKLDDVFDIFRGLLREREVSIASGEKQNTNVAPAVTSVITAQDIEAMGARTLEEALASVPGLHVMYNYIGYAPIYAVRGIFTPSNPEILVMVDNVPIKAMNTGGTGRGWSHFPVSAIARIEIIRGPGSALYGADAFSGVINIITKTAEDIPHMEAGLRAGSYQTHEGWLSYGKQYQDMDVAVTLDVIDSDGFDGILLSDAQSYYDRILQTQASNAPGQVQLEKNNFDLSLNLGYRDWCLRTLYQQRKLGQGIGGALPPPDAPPQRMDESRLLLSLDRTWWFSSDWELQTQLSYYRRRFSSGIYTFFPPNAFNGAYPDGMLMDSSLGQTNSRGEVSAFYYGWRKHSLRFGAGYAQEDFKDFTWRANFGIDASGTPILPGSPLRDMTDTSAAALPETLRKNSFVYLQDSWRITPDWSLTSGLRYDKYSDFGDTVNPRLALVHQFNPRLSGKLLYGSAFRSPSLDELYVKNTGAILGNPQVKPEQIKTWELAFDYRTCPNVYLSGNIFHYKIDDKILRLPELIGDTPVKLYQNAGSQVGKGLELEIRWKLNPKASILMNYAYLYTRDHNAQPVYAMPHQSGYLRFDWLLGQHWFVDTQVNWVADRKRVAPDPRPSAEAYFNVGVTLRYKGLQNKPWDFALGVRNLFDRDIRTAMPYEPGATGYFAQDIPMAEREWFAEIRYRF